LNITEAAPSLEEVIREEMGIYYDNTRKIWTAQVPTGAKYQNGRPKYSKASAKTKKEAEK